MKKTKGMIRFIIFLASKHETFNGKLQTQAPYFPFLNKETRKLFDYILSTVSTDDLPRTAAISDLDIK